MSGLPPATALLIAKRVTRGSTRYTFKITGPAGSAVVSVIDPVSFEAKVGAVFHVDADLVPGRDLLFCFRPIPAGGSAA